MNAVVMRSTGAETAAYGGLVDAIGGIAGAVLAIIGLNGFDPVGMAAIAAIVLGGALLVQGATILSEYAYMTSQAEPAESASAPAEFRAAEGLAATFMVGAAAIVLGVLAVLGISSVELTAVAVIAFGSALVLSSGSFRQLYVLRGQLLHAAAPGSHSGPELLVGQMASGSAGVQLLAGLGAIVLGVLAVAGLRPTVLTLAGLLVLGIAVLLSGTALSSLLLSFMRPAQSGSRRAPA